jgi:hypothetical protein
MPQEVTHIAKMTAKRHKRRKDDLSLPNLEKEDCFCRSSDEQFLAKLCILSLNWFDLYVWKTLIPHMSHLRCFSDYSLELEN